MALTKEQVIELLQSEKMDLEPTQNQLCFPILKRIYSKMSAGLLLPSIQVCENLIINGHHRYIAAILAGYQLGRVTSIKSGAKQPMEWKLLTIADEDWDMSSDIKMFNEEDAKYNDLDLEDIIGIIT